MSEIKSKHTFINKMHEVMTFKHQLIEDKMSIGIFDSVFGVSSPRVGTIWVEFKYGLNAEVRPSQFAWGTDMWKHTRNTFYVWNPVPHVWVACTAAYIKYMAHKTYFTSMRMDHLIDHELPSHHFDGGLITGQLHVDRLAVRDFLLHTLP